MTSTLTTAERMATKVQISLYDLEVLADCLATLDGFKGYAIDRAAGKHINVIYCNDHEPEAA